MFTPKIQSSNCVLDDGQTFESYIEPIPQLHDGIHFSYRRMLFENVSAMDATAKAMVDQGDPAKADRYRATKMAEQIGGWSELDGDGKQLAVSVERVRTLPGILFRRLSHIIAGYDAGDELPGSPIVKDSDSVSKTLAAFEDTEDTAGNSNAG